MLPRRLGAQVPFCFPETCGDRERYFHGREEELDYIASKLLPDAKRLACPMLRTCSVSGLGGVGKTELAYQYINKHRRDYDVIIFITADKTLRLSRQYKTLAVRLGILAESEKLDAEQCREALRSWFKIPLKSANSSDQRQDQANQNELATWLLIFDNVEDWATIELYWPYKGHGSVLVTSRRVDVLPQLEPSGTTSTLSLKDLNTAEAATVLNHYAGSGNDDSSIVGEASANIARRLHGFPLALMQVGSYIQQSKISIPKFAEIHPSESDLYNVYLEESPLRGYTSNIGSAWSLESLSQDDQASQGIFAVLCLFAFLDAVGIPEDLVRPTAFRSHVPNYPSNESSLYRCCETLMAQSLVERDNDSNWTIHRIVQEVVRAKVASDAALSEAVLHDVYSRIARRWPGLGEPYVIGTQGRIARWSLCEKLVLHVSSLRNCYLELKRAGHVSTLCLKLCELLCEAASYHVERGEHQEGTQHLTVAASIFESTETPKGPETIEHELRICRGKIGLAFLARDGDELFHCASRTMEIESERHLVSGQPSVGLAAALHHMGIAYNMAALYHKAIEVLEESIAVRKSLPGFKKDWLFNGYYHLAHAHLLLKNNERAANILVTAINDRIEVLGDKDRVSMKTGALFYTLGDVRYHQRRFEDSLAMHSEAYIHVKETAGEQSLVALHCKFKVALHCTRQHDFARAESYFEEILPGYRLKRHARRYIPRAAFAYAECQKSAGKEHRALLEEAVAVFNEFSTYDQRTCDSITYKDATSLVLYDYL
ncbi:P-loop containing nucleoside triphosphate hydrolase protein [Nemania diffusa]|nr:P-loop containing nucleoside triphosphate hydrolase protein [Nemania diffusa]